MSGDNKTSYDLMNYLLQAGQPLSHELSELLAAYGPPPQMPDYRGDWQEYAHAARVFENLSATPEAAARRDAMARYFAKWGGEVNAPRSEG